MGMVRYLAYITKGTSEDEAIELLNVLKSVLSKGEHYSHIFVSNIENDYNIELDSEMSRAVARVDQAANYYDHVVFLGNDKEAEKRYDRYMSKTSRIKKESISYSRIAWEAKDDSLSSVMDSLLKRLKAETDPAIKSEIKKGLDILNKRLWPELNTE